MQKLFLSITILFLSLSTIAQKKEQPKDTTRYFYLILPQKKWQELITLIKSADEKPSVVNGWINLIAGQAQELKQNTDTTTTKKNGK